MRRAHRGHRSGVWIDAIKAVQVRIQKSLPAPLATHRFLERELAALDSVGRLIEVQHAVGPAIRRHDDVDVEIDHAIEVVLPRHDGEIDVPDEDQGRSVPVVTGCTCPVFRRHFPQA